MTPGQSRVAVLLILLALMEALVQPGIKAWWHSVLSSIGGAVAKK